MNALSKSKYLLRNLVDRLSIKNISSDEFEYYKKFI